MAAVSQQITRLPGRPAAALLKAENLGIEYPDAKDRIPSNAPALPGRPGAGHVLFHIISGENCHRVQ